MHFCKGFFLKFQELLLTLSLARSIPLVSFYTSLRTSENPEFSGVFRGCRKRPVASNGLRTLLDYIKLSLYRNESADSRAVITGGGCGGRVAGPPKKFNT